MITFSRIAGCGFLALASLLAADAVAAPPPAEAFGVVPQIANVELNPKGNLLAWSDQSGAEPMVVIFDLEKGSEKRRMGVGGDADLNGLDWADDETLLIHLSVLREWGAGVGSLQYDMQRILAVDAGGGPTRILLMNSQEQKFVTGARLLALRTSKPKTVVMSTWDYLESKRGREIDSRLIGGRKDAGWIHNVFEVDTTTGKGRLLDHGTYLTTQWVVERSGLPIARSEWDAEKRVYRLTVRDGGGWREVHRQEDGEAPSLHGLTADQTAIVALAANGKPHNALWAIPLDGSGARVLAEDERYDVESVVRDGGATPVGAWIGGPAPKMLWFDQKYEARAKALTRAFPGRGVAIYGLSTDGARAIARVGDHSAPAVYYFIDFAKGKADIVGEHYPGLEKATLGSVQSTTYKARDGYEIPAYVTTPPGVEPKNLPLVVLPHGGPEARDEPEFDWLAQFIATRGYVVLQPQFRGSTGFGEAHRLAGYRQWGGLMQDDVTDGVKALIEQGLVDARRVCIVGASYGGYAALAGAAFTPDLYACAASINGLSDLPAMIGAEAKRHGKESNSLAYWRDHIGAATDANVIAKSPARAAGAIRAPVLLLHGVDDTIVPVAQSEMMARSLASLSKRHTFVKLPGEDHYLSRSDTRVRVLKELESFLAAHLHAD